jgi:ATP-dependent Clp protease ATP-binding subunit ClpA
LKPGAGLFSKFSPASRRVLRVAEQECRNHSHYYVGAEHLLVALLEERDPSILRSLNDGGIDVREVHAEVRQALGTGDDRVWEGILVTPRVRKIISLAERRVGDREIAPIDLFEALRNEGGSLAAEILRRAAPRNTASATE